MVQVPPTLLAQALACATGMKPALRAALGGGKVSAGVCVTIGNLNELISVDLCPIFGGARLRFYVGLYAVQLGHPGRYLHTFSNLSTVCAKCRHFSLSSA